MSGNFFREFPKNCQKIYRIFSTFSGSKKKTVNLVPKLVENHYIDQNLAKLFHKTPKNRKFFLENLNFLRFSAPSAPKIWSVMFQKS